MIFWEDTDKLGFTARCEYDGVKFIVTVYKGEIALTESFWPSFTPTFGMDIVDSQKSSMIAEKLAKKIEKKLKK